MAKFTVPDDARSRVSARRDIVAIVMVAVAAAVVCARFNLSEALLKWTRPFERLQLDELPAVLLVIAISLVWFSTRRYAEAERQLRLRETAERRLAEALAENKRLGQQHVDLQEAERKALARDLHDELGQYLNAMKLDAVSIREATAARADLHRTASALIVNIDRVYGVVRGLIRQLRPVAFDDLGVGAALEHCVNEWRLRLPTAAIDLSITGDLQALDETRALVLYRLVQEALTNIARHSDAHQVLIRIGAAAAGDAAPCLEILISDDGGGADMSAPKSGLGLVGMRERVCAQGGSIAVVSERGAGFKIIASLPVIGP
jgi:glucose-6-phosphate-specific signal transduction histidine kinase